MSADNFTIKSKIVYTIQSAHGETQCNGLKGLEEHIDGLLGAYLDRIENIRTGLLSRDKLKIHDFMMGSYDELQTIFALKDKAQEIREDLKRASENSCDCCERSRDDWNQ